MASYNPPTENITSFNSSLFNQPEETLSKAEADQLYLSKKNNDVSTAPNTDFNGAVTIKGTQNFGVQNVAGGVTNINRRLRFNDVNGNATGYGDMVYGSGPELLITSYSLASTLLSTFIRFQTCPAGSTTPVLKLEVGDTVTKITNRLDVGTSGVSGSSWFRQPIHFYDVNSPYSTFCQLYVSGSAMDYIMNAGATTASTHRFTTYDNAGAPSNPLVITSSAVNVLPKLNLSGGLFLNDTGSYCNMYTSGNIVSYTAYAGTTTATSHRFYTYNNANVGSFPLEITSAGVTVTPNLNLGNRLVYNASSYSFPLASQQTQGYYLKTTGSALATPTYVSNTYITCVTSPTIAIGVWRIDYSVTNTISVGGNITATDTLVSTTINNSTPVAFTGAQQITHTTENYSAGDKHIITGSFTYNQSTAGVLYLTINRVFASGSYSWVGELAVTRLS